jgi:hypothetical protein
MRAVSVVPPLVGKVKWEQFEPGCRDSSSDSRHRIGDAFFVPVIDDDPRTFGRQGLCDGEAYPSR